MSARGQFNDGKSAVGHAVTLSLSAGAVDLIGPGKVRRARWPLAEIEVLEVLAGGRGIRLSSRAQPDARLTIEGADDLAAWAKIAPGLTRRRASPAQVIKALAWTALAAGLAFAVYRGLPWLVEPLAAVLPAAWEAEIGEATVDQALMMFGAPAGQGRFCTGAGAEAALQELGARLGGTGAAAVRVRVQIADAEPANAFAAPGGRIVLLRGLIEEARAPAEVAGVLAHEMGHVIARHPTEALLRQAGLTTLIEALFAGSSLGQAGGVLAMLTYSRADEEEADAIAQSLLGAAGIRTDGLARFFARMAEDEAEGWSLPPLLSTHPPAAARQEAVGESDPAGDEGLTPDAWAALRAACATPG
ncbi:MAG: M48 family metallopeptidase [Alphaproteobacteria bacterium]|nr:M48 family metallopeptidase [Alphaproteobacteria bacterium]